MLDRTFQGWRFAQQIDCAIDTSSIETLLAKILKEIFVFPFLPSNNRCQEKVRLLIGKLLYLFNHLIARLRCDLTLACGTKPGTDPSEENSKKVMDFSNRPHRGSRVVTCRFLTDRDRWTETGKKIDVRLRELTDKLPGVRGQTFEIAALAFRVEGVKGERALAAPRNTGEANELVTLER